MAAPVRRSFSRRAFFGLPDAPARAQAHIGETCLAFNQVACESCTEACEAGAIGFARVGTIKQPYIDPERCTACEACVSICPVAALSIERPSKENA